MSKIHIAGIGGEGWSWIAKVLLENGHEITGCDVNENNHIKFLRQIGLQNFQLGNSGTHITPDLDYFLYTSALLSNAENKKELDKAKELGITALDRNEFLPILLKDRKVIGIAGTHGKTTTSALVSYLLDALGDECGFGVGGTTQNFETNGRNGNSETFVIEADEFADAFLGLNPYASIITNMEMDHHDYFKNFETYKNSFAKYINQNKEFVVVFGDDKELLSLAELSGKSFHTYGEDLNNKYKIENIEINELSTKWNLTFDNKNYNLEILFPGKQYAYNATAAVILCVGLGYEIEKIASLLKGFKGTQRRFESTKINNVTIINDYGHHPTEIKITLEGALESAKSVRKKVFVVYEPHQYKRCSELLDSFEGIFIGADLLLQTSIFPSREQPPYSITNEQFFETCSKGLRNDQKVYIENWENCSDITMRNIPKKEEVLILVFAVGHGSTIVKNILEKIKN
jgi:UDP-N-acetylmuramate--alanine ligase